ncbi:glutathione peroxidase [Mesonia ostreae]|uniref:Glutathione peroxidase n=1 Tax=Mesonia ostreae TaxID=861110 RepID=A0ABU2KG07_9FLAO|nr:glutathione peroxidase [Mesonia ostreae]MDT0293616.1 glutathione peroxidase [Mesonia ostreae]
MSKFHTYQIASSSGEKINFKDFKNKVVLIVNTATKCGLASQFKELESLHQKYKDQGLVVIGFPCNQFMGQEPVINEEMQSACELNFGVTFSLTEKINVNGKNTHPIFNYLKSHLDGFLTSKIKWNFTKFLVDKNGKPFKRFTSATSPKKMQKDIERLLKM